ncbi:hypothetical protein Slin15195_G002250 [Septoria linicola]|uniref:F-box domain-containing protein n=1 Tax=Septoria linicola TaxID=215465 RepID=A0A9Q9ECP1_9PEZI|nr:hypothetical protein Slin14017_G002270 [Septoria linicola]USW46906.1 hypothetical protein Slin15195_G002250 [Septoria linicola]
MAIVDGLTPLKIRGKRRGIPAEKWTSGRRRNVSLQKRQAPVENHSTVDAPPSKQRRTRPPQDESPLEQLPAEILQEIFEYAGNVDLPVVSRQLAAKLSKSRHLQSELAGRLLEPILDTQHGSRPSAKELRVATRLLNSRFVTWQFFTTWLLRRHDNLVEGESHDWPKLWAALRPSHALLPPRKLLLPPFTPEKVAFLSTLAQNINDVAALDSSYSEDVYEGLIAAIRAGHADVVALLLGMGVSSDTELLRIAVVDADCNKDVVEMLVNAAMTSRSSNGRSTGALDLLDPAIWSWAEHARERGNDRGAWLVSYLQALQRKTVPSR